MRKCGKILYDRNRPQITKWRMQLPCCIPKAIYTHSEYVLLLFRCNNGCTNALQQYVLRTLSVLI